MAAAVSTASKPPSSPWIVSRPTDLALIVGAPLLILPALFGLAEIFGALAVSAAVLVTLSTAHHLPGFLRTYGDPELFARYRFRFLVVPPLVLGVVWWLTWHQLATVLFVSLVWAIWHGLMQVYGVMRIYAAKAGEPAGLTPKLDRAMCLSGFVAVLVSGGLVQERVVAAAEGSGVFGLTALMGPTLQAVALGVFGLVFVAWVAQHVRQARSGQPVSWLKITSLLLSLGYLAVCWSLLGRNLLLGLAAFEAFHDIQYMAVAWGYNQRLVSTGKSNRMLSLLCSPNAASVALYVGVIVTYGFIAVLAMDLSRDVGIHHLGVSLVVAFAATSGLLHFYFDGFIWKVRQPKTQRDLGIEVSDEGTGYPLFSRLREGAQALLVAGPLVVLGLLAFNLDGVEVPMRGALARTFPGDGELQFQYAAALEKAGQADRAAEAYRQAAALAPDALGARVALARIEMQRGDLAAAVVELEQIVALAPERTDASLLLARLALQRGDFASVESTVAALLARPAPEVHAEAQGANLMLDSGDPGGVARSAHEAAGPDRSQYEYTRVEALSVLAEAQAARGDFAAAVETLDRARRNPAARTDPRLSARLEALRVRYGLSAREASAAP